MPMSSSQAVTPKLTKVDKAAILLLSLGETDAAQVLREIWAEVAASSDTGMANVG